MKIKTFILKGERKYAIYLPPDYETSQRTYPVFTCCMAVDRMGSVWESPAHHRFGNTGLKSSIYDRCDAGCQYRAASLL